MGTRCFEFEEKFARVCKAPAAISLVSCTAALHLALVDAGIGPGDEVIIPVTTFVSTYESIIYTGATPVLVDVEQQRHTIDIESCARAVTRKTKAIIPVHFGGMPCEMDSLCALARAHNLVIIEDAAHAFPSYYNEKMCGTFGDYGCYSFYATKTLTTGEGGMLTLSDSSRADRIRRLRLHGISKDAWKRYAADGSPYYDVLETGYKYNMTDIAAALGISQLARYESAQQERERIAASYDRAFESHPSFEIMREGAGMHSSHHLYVLKLNAGRFSISRDQFCALLKEAGIHTSLHFIPLHRFTSVRAHSGEHNFTVADSAFDRSVSLPIYPDLSPNEVAYIIATIIDLAEKHVR